MEVEISHFVKDCDEYQEFARFYVLHDILFDSEMDRRLNQTVTPRSDRKKP